MKCSTFRIFGVLLAGSVFVLASAAPSLAVDGPRRGVRNFEQLFKRLDKNGDGKLTREEMGAPNLFKRLDADGDGAVTLEEARTYGKIRSISDPERYDPAKPLPVSKSGAFKDLAFSRDYDPGERDPAGRWRGGTETLRLLVHKGKLFASLGYWTDKPYGKAKGEEPWTGAQLLRKDSPDGRWVVDASFGESFLRVEGMISAVFSTDAEGKALAEPVNILVAGPSSRTLTVCTRDDESGKWASIPIETRVRRGGIRSFCTHADTETGVHHLFGGGRGFILRGAFSPGAPGRLVWHPEPELAGTGRVMCMAEANGVLYAAAGISDDDPEKGGLYRRIDGKEPRWERVWQWPFVRVEDKDETEIMRGLTAVPDPAGGGHDVLVGTCNYPGVVYRIDPKKDFEAVTELDIRVYFARAWKVPSMKGACLSAYNRLVPATDPDTGEKVHLIGLWVNHPPRGDRDLAMSAWYLVRHGDGTYGHGRVFAPEALPNHPERGLEAVRTIEASPFPEDGGRVLFMGGFDCAKQDSHNTAWIYRGVVSKGGDSTAGAARHEWVTPAVTAPGVVQRVIESSAAKAEVSYHVFLPEGYDTSESRRFPALYWLHGSGGGGAGIRPLAAHFGEAMREGKVAPFIVVFPNGLANGMWCDSHDGRTPVETILVKELIPDVDANFRTLASREGRMIEGFSMGGYGAARLGFKYADLFGAVSILGGGPLQKDLDYTPRVGPFNREKILQDVYGGDHEYFYGQSPWFLAEKNAEVLRKELKIRQVVGALDETLPANRWLHGRLEKLEIPHDYIELPGVGHDPMGVLEAMGGATWGFYKEAFAK